MLSSSLKRCYLKNPTSYNVSRCLFTTISRSGYRGVEFKSFGKQQVPLRIGSIAPNFKAPCTISNIEKDNQGNNFDFYRFSDDKSWIIFLSHPMDFTPVCTSELGKFALLKNEFDKRNTKVIGLSVNALGTHEEWIEDIEDIFMPNDVEFMIPMISDLELRVAYLYNMIDANAYINKNDENPNPSGIMYPYAVRSLYIIDPKKRIRMVESYPVSTGRNTDEILRVLDSLQLYDKTGLITPVNWKQGDDVMIQSSLTTNEAKEKYGTINEKKSYIRFTKSPLFSKKSVKNSLIIPINISETETEYKNDIINYKSIMLLIALVLNSIYLNSSDEIQRLKKLISE